MANETLTVQGAAILAAIKSGFAAGGVDEWDAPEFSDARKLSRDITWEFTGWHDTARCIEVHGKLGGERLAAGVRDVEVEADDEGSFAASIPGTGVGYVARTESEAVQGALAIFATTRFVVVADFYRSAEVAQIG
jgi:hypothetical protein